MSEKTLAEQVAELEQLFHTLTAELRRRGQEIRKLRAERDEARAERDRLRAGQDRWEADPLRVHLDPKSIMNYPEPEPKRLTVHALNVAPVGSWLWNGVRPAYKLEGGRWGFPGLAGTRTSEEVISLGWDTARLETGGE